MKARLVLGVAAAVTVGALLVLRSERPGEAEYAVPEECPARAVSGAVQEPHDQAIPAGEQQPAEKASLLR